MNAMNEVRKLKRKIRASLVSTQKLKSERSVNTIRALGVHLHKLQIIENSIENHNGTIDGRLIQRIKNYQKELEEASPLLERLESVNDLKSYAVTLQTRLTRTSRLLDTWLDDFKESDFGHERVLIAQVKLASDSWQSLRLKSGIEFTDILDSSLNEISKQVVTLDEFLSIQLLKNNNSEQEVVNLVSKFNLDKREIGDTIKPLQSALASLVSAMKRIKQDVTLQEVLQETKNQVSKVKKKNRNEDTHLEKLKEKEESIEAIREKIVKSNPSDPDVLELKDELLFSLKHLKELRLIKEEYIGDSDQLITLLESAKEQAIKNPGKPIALHNKLFATHNTATIIKAEQVKQKKSDRRFNTTY